ncbi:MAG: hypothetical protein JKY95_09250 [Planctomycetaceae bacterium]|nr:hypothetical protein [Planctomycetaceae bacterium]
MTAICFRFLLLAFLAMPLTVLGGELPKLTSLSNASIKYKVPAKHYVILRHNDIEAIIADNNAINDDVLSNHRSGYSGVVSLKHTKQKRNIFVPGIAGLNYEHIHDGTTQERNILFEPRNAPMELRVINDRTAELYQAPTQHWGLESCLRYELLDDGVIEMTLECIPHRKTFKNDYIGLFWASYIHQPESLDIHFQGAKQGNQTQWIQGVTPSHGVLATHVGRHDARVFKHDQDFPLTLAFNRSEYQFASPWYYGVSHDMALAFLFREKDQIRLTQSPSGGGQGNPAWDFQFFIPDYKIGQRYQMVMQAMYLPFQSSKQIESATKTHRQALQLEDFPAELVQFTAAKNNPVFTAQGEGHWDVKIRERGWILRDNNQYHMWYTGYDGTREGQKFLGYATSSDGLKWKPHPKNPINTEHWIEDMMVVKQDGTFYMFAEGEQDQAQLLTSKDGLKWTRQGTLDIRKVDGTPIKPGPRGTPTAWYEKGIWYLFYERFDAGVWLATSKDMKTWTNLQDAPVLLPGPDLADRDLIAMNQIVKHNGRYYAYYHGAAKIPDENNQNLWSTSIAVSDDLIHWKKYDNNPLQPRSENKSSGILINTGKGKTKSFRLYTMHGKVDVHFGK